MERIVDWVEVGKIGCSVEVEMLAGLVEEVVGRMDVVAEPERSWEGDNTTGLSKGNVRGFKESTLNFQRWNEEF